VFFSVFLIHMSSPIPHLTHHPPTSPHPHTPSQEDIIFIGKSTGTQDILVETTYPLFCRLRDTADIALINEADCRGFVLTAAVPSSGKGEDGGEEAVVDMERRLGTLEERPQFVSRFFCPRVGIDEDPVTGSAHCHLGPYWKAKFNTENGTGRNGGTSALPLVAFQASPRGGLLRVSVDDEGGRVSLRGGAVTTSKGELWR
jgi:hypothetical protein